LEQPQFVSKVLEYGSDIIT